MREKRLRAERMALQAELAVLRRPSLKNGQARKRVKVGFFRSVAIFAFGAGGRVVNTELARTSQFPTSFSGEDE